MISTKVLNKNLTHCSLYRNVLRHIYSTKQVTATLHGGIPSPTSIHYTRLVARWLPKCTKALHTHPPALTPLTTQITLLYLQTPPKILRTGHHQPGPNPATWSVATPYSWKAPRDVLNQPWIAHILTGDVDYAPFWLSNTWGKEQQTTITKNSETHKTQRPHSTSQSVAEWPWATNMTSSASTYLTVKGK